MKTVALSKQYVVGSAVFDSLQFREPKLSDYRQIGKVAEGRRGVVVTYSEAVWLYADRLVEGVPTGALGELDLIDAMAIESTIFDFFSDANRKLRELASSYSGSDGAQPTSTS